MLRYTLQVVSLARSSQGPSAGDRVGIAAAVSAFYLDEVVNSGPCHAERKSVFGMPCTILRTSEWTTGSSGNGANVGGGRGGE